MQELIGRLIGDPNGRDDLRITGFRWDGKVSLTNEETGENTQLTREGVVAIEDEAEARGMVLSVERVTCPRCEHWKLRGQDHSHTENAEDEIKPRRARLQAALDAVDESVFGEVA